MAEGGVSLEGGVNQEDGVESGGENGNGDLGLRGGPGDRIK